MKNTEIESRIQDLINYVQNLRDTLPELIRNHSVIVGKLEELECLQAEYSIVLDIDYSNVKAMALRDVITESKAWIDIEIRFDSLMEDFEAWADDSTKKIAEAINEIYIEQLESIQNWLHIEDTDDEDTLDDMLADTISRLKQFEYL